MRHKLSRFFIHIGYGIEEKYPFCCVLAFSIVCLQNWRFPPQILGGSNRFGGYVPCRIFHKPDTSPKEIRAEWLRRQALLKELTRLYGRIE